MMLSAAELKRLKSYEGYYAKLFFQDGEVTIARIDSLTTAPDGTQQLVYNDIRETNVWEAYEATDEAFCIPAEKIASFEIVEMN